MSSTESTDGVAVTDAEIRIVNDAGWPFRVGTLATVAILEVGPIPAWDSLGDTLRNAPALWLALPALLFVLYALIALAFRRSEITINRATRTLRHWQRLGPRPTNAVYSLDEFDAILLVDDETVFTVELRYAPVDDDLIRPVGLAVVWGKKAKSTKELTDLLTAELALPLELDRRR